MLWRLARSEAKREVNRKWALFSVKNLLLPTCQLFLCNLFYSFLQRGEFSLHTFKTLQPIGSSFKSSVALQHTIADQFVPEKYPNYGNFMICNNVKRLTSNNYILKKENSNTSLLAYWCLPNWLHFISFTLVFLRIQLC